MIEFLTVLTGLITGPQPVQLQALPTVAAVELYLDGDSVGRKEAPPWVFEVDFGPGFSPHRLEAIASTADGATGSIQKWVNYGHFHLEGRLVLEVPETGLARQGRVLWPSVEDRLLEYLEVRLDGEAVETSLDGRFTLPDYDPGQLHYLATEVAYQSDLEALGGAFFGGDRGVALTTRLTAVPVALEPGTELPTSLDGWVQVGGEPVPVLSSHTEGAVIAIVRDTHLDATVDILLRKKREKFYAQPGRILDTADRVVFQMTHELPRDPRGVFRSLPVLPEFYKGGMWHLLSKYAPRVDGPIPQHLWTNLLLAGRRISDVQRPRAVVLVLSKRPKDHSALSFETAQRYLEAIRAPLFVWAFEDETYERLQISRSERFFAGPEGMVELFQALDTELGQQRTLWIEGEIGPVEVTLGPEAQGIRLVQ